MARTERQRLVNFNTSTTANMPDTDDFDHGEIAVRYNTDNPELIIKRADDSLVTFKPNSVKIYQNHSGSAFPGQSATCDVTDGNIISYFDGLTVMIKLGYAPDPEYGLSFQINGLGYKPVKYSDGTHVGDEWVSGDEIMLVYNGSMEGSTGAWQVVNSKKSSSVVVRTWTNEHSSKDYMYLEAAEANSTVSMTSTLDTAPNLEYSTDGVNFQEWQHTTADGTHTFDTLTLTAVGDRVYLRGDNQNGLGFLPEGTEAPSFSNFVMTGGINAGGNIMSLLDTDVELTEVPQFGLIGLFAIMGEGLEAALLTPLSMDSITTIGYNGCASMYYGCTAIASAADMAALTTIGNYGCAGMYYNCASLTSAADMPSLTAIGYSGCYSMYGGCTFNMSSDGTTLNFDFPNPPITTIGEEPETLSTVYDIAFWMGNTNGFDFVNLYSEPNVQEYGSVRFSHIGSTSGSVWIPTSGSVDVEVVASPNEGYQFVKWQYSPDGQEYTDISGATDTTYNTVLVQPGDYYYKGVFAENPDYLCFTANKAGATLRMTGIETIGFSGDSFSLEYSTDGDTWQSLNFTSSGSPEEGLVTRVSDTLTFGSVGDKVYFRGDNPSGTSTAGTLFGSLDMGYHYAFAGGEDTETADNEFSVGGDIQTIVDKTGLNKTAGCFYSLFGAGDDRDLYPGMILITSAPDLTATVLTDYCYYVMFAHQTLLSRPAEFPVLTFDSLSGTSLESYMLAEMYLSCYGLLEPANLNSLVFSGHSDLSKCYYNLNGMYENDTFDITEDNGASIAGFGGLVFPYESNVSGDTLPASSANFAGVVGNHNGFDTVQVVFNTDSQSYGSIYFNVDESLVIRGGGSNYSTPNILWLQDGGNVPITVTASPEQGYRFVKWQSSSDGDTWTDIPGATNPVYAETLTAVGNYYYKPVFESDS